MNSRRPCRLTPCSRATRPRAAPRFGLHLPTFQHSWLEHDEVNEAVPVLLVVCTRAGFMEDSRHRKKMRMQLKRNETRVAKVDPTDPATAFTSGPYGHGSRVFAKVPCRFAAPFYTAQDNFEISTLYLLRMLLLYSSSSGRDGDGGCLRFEICSCLDLTRQVFVYDQCKEHTECRLQVETTAGCSSSMYISHPGRVYCWLNRSVAMRSVAVKS